MSIRVIPVGDVAAATPYWGLAKKFGRQVRASGLRTKHVIYGEVEFRVEHYPESMETKVFVKAGEPHGYQFYTTSPNVQWAGGDAFYPGGSIVYVALPQLRQDGGIVDAPLRVKPVRSLVEAPPDLGDGRLAWPYTPMPTDQVELNNVMQTTFVVKGLWQLNGYPEPTYSIVETLPDGTQRTLSTYLTAWVQPGAELFSYGMFIPNRLDFTIDRGYDIAPVQVKAGQRVMQRPKDADWPQRYCVREVGGRRFVVMHAADDTFSCWPLLGTSELDRSEPPLAAVPNEFVQTVLPDYPSWVYAKTGKESERVDAPKAEPRTTFHFNSTGTRAIAAMVERTAAGVRYSEIDYSGRVDGSGTRLGWRNAKATAIFDGGSSVSITFHTEWLIDRYEPTTGRPVYYGPTVEVDRGEAKVNPVKRLFGGAGNAEPLAYDELGIVELELSIELFGETGFTFTVNVANELSPSVLREKHRGRLMEVAYAKPLDWAGEHPGMGGMFAEAVGDIRTDHILEMWLRAYQHEDQVALAFANDGDSGLDPPTKADVLFYNQTLDLEIGAVPVLQTNGAGHGTDPITDPETGEVIALPAPAHEFIHCSTNRWNQHNPFDSDAHPRIAYEGFITQLDLGALAFYHVVRIYDVTVDPAPFKAPEYPLLVYEDNLLDYRREYHKILCQHGERVRAIVMGREVKSHYVGSTAKTYREWATAWAEKAVPTWPDDPGETLLETAECNTLLYAPKNGNVSPLPWWLEGACHACFLQALRHSVAKQYATVQAYRDPSVFAEIPSPATAVALNSIDESNIDDFLLYVYNIKTIKTLHKPAVTTVIWEHYAAVGNPFDAHYGFVLGDWIATSSAFALEYIRAFKGMAEVYSIGIGPPPSGDEYYYDNTALYASITRAAAEYAEAHLIVPTADGELKHLVLPDTVDLAKNRLVMRGFDMANWYYVQLRNLYISPAEQLNDEARIIVTPEGHYSFCYTGHFAATRQFTSQSIMYTGKAFGDPAEPLYVDVARLDYHVDVGTDGLTDEDFEWCPVEQVGWFYGKRKCSHLMLYNMAYDPDFKSKFPDYIPTGELEEGGDALKYKKDDFRSTFYVLTDTYDQPIFAPSFKTTGYFAPLVWLSRISVCGAIDSANATYAKLSLNGDRRRLRLSPLFF